VIASLNDFIIKHCPNVTTVSTDGWEFLHSQRGGSGAAAAKMIKSSARADKLTYFEMNQWWTSSQLEGM
jgi:hypothetical protein